MATQYEDSRFPNYPIDPLHMAAQHGDLPAVKSMLETDLRDRLNAFDDCRYTPLMWAAKEGHFEMVKLLLKYGADINAHDESIISDTAISEIVTDATPEMVTLLMENGADPSIRGWMQLNAFDRVEKHPNREEIIKILQKRSDA